RNCRANPPTLAASATSIGLDLNPSEGVLSANFGIVERWIMPALVPRAGLLLIVLCVALALRVGAAFALQRWLDRKDPPELCLIAGDAEGYWGLAKKIAAGENYEFYQPPRKVLRMPGFPILLAACMKLAGDQNLLAARLALAAVGTIACGLVYWLGREL